MRSLVVLCMFLSCSLAQQLCTDIIPCTQTQCTYFPDWSKQWCRKTCGYCGGPQPPTQPPTLPPNPQPGQGQCGMPTFQAGRVIGGTAARPGEWPWQVGIEFNGRFHCGGSLVNSRWLVTAAHCVDRTYPSGFKLTLGDHTRGSRDGSEQVFNAERVIAHPSYDRRRLDSDIALIKLSSPAKFNNRVKPICLPQQGVSAPVGSTCYITGWGKTSHPGSAAYVLQKSPLKVVDRKVCNSLNQQGTGNSITSAMICGGFGPSDRRGGCHGDSGGPFVCKSGNKWTLHGAVSWGSRECTTSKAYTVFARVSEFRTWLDQHINT